MFQIVVIMLKCCPCVVHRVDIHTLHSPGELLLQSLQREEVVAVDEHITGIGVAVVAAGVVQEIRGSMAGSCPLPIHVNSSFCISLSSYAISNEKVIIFSSFAAPCNCRMASPASRRRSFLYRPCFEASASVGGRFPR